MDNEYTDREKRLKSIILPLLRMITDTEINVTIDSEGNVLLNDICIGSSGMIKGMRIDNGSTLVFDYGEDNIREILFDDPEYPLSVNDGNIKTIFEYSKSGKSVDIIYDIYKNNA